MTEYSKSIVRDWNREIADEARREAASRAGNGWWKAVSWTALWLLWVVLLAAFLGPVKPLGW